MKTVQLKVEKKDAGTRMMVDLRAKGASYDEIADLMADQGYVSEKTGKPLASITIRHRVEEYWAKHGPLGPTPDFVKQPSEAGYKEALHKTLLTVLSSNDLDPETKLKLIESIQMAQKAS
jgi:hypothetical protein